MWGVSFFVLCMILQLKSAMSFGKYCNFRRLSLSRSLSGRIADSTDHTQCFRTVGLRMQTISSELTTNRPEKSRLRLLVDGPHATNALFRAELKKELTFFRGCAASFTEITPTSALIIAEGKTRQLDKFIDWVKLYSTPLTQRKPNFQGPSMTIYIADTQWESFSGNMRGFSSSSDAPELGALEGAQLEGDGRMDARAMTGTDESV